MQQTTNTCCRSKTNQSNQNQYVKNTTALVHKKKKLKIYVNF